MFCSASQSVVAFPLRSAKNQSLTLSCADVGLVPSFGAYDWVSSWRSSPQPEEGLLCDTRPRTALHLSSGALFSGQRDRVVTPLAPFPPNQPQTAYREYLRLRCGPC